jgi:hypothetical protein
MEMVRLLPEHVRLVSADAASRLALEAYSNTWGTPVSFQTAHGTYLSASGNGGGAVRANRNAIGPWERFHLIADGALTDGAVISIQTGDGHYFSAKPRGALQADRTTIGPWEEFTLINHSAPGGDLEQGHQVSLKTAHNTYVVSGDSGSANANRGEIGPWETFTVVRHPDF